jgi:type II secretory pathway pseudopilin PulG
MSKTDKLLARGIAFAEDGLEATARSLFRAVIEEEPINQLAWAWYVQSFSDQEERIQAFDEYLQIFPHDQTAHKFQVSLLKHQYGRWKQLAVDAVQEVTFTQKKVAQEVKNKDHAVKRSRLVTILISLFLICVICVASITSTTKISSLANQIDDLRNEYGALQQAYSSLNSDFDTLSTDHRALVSQHNTLVDDYNKLVSEHNTLLGEYDWLKSIAITPPYILTNGRNVHLALKKIDGTIIYWDVPFSALEHNLERGNVLRDRINSGSQEYSLHLRNTITDETFYVPDYRYFVDQSPFANVIGDLYAQSADSDAFIREVWNIVAQLTTYSADITDTPRYPLETLLAGGGDCEDTAILFASMVLAAPVDWKVQLVYMDGDHPTSPLTMNHLSVHVVTDRSAYDVETTSKAEVDPYPDGVNGWYYDVE